MSSLFVACLNQHTALRFRARKLLIPPESKRINNFIIHHRLDRFFSSSTPMLKSASQKDNTVRTSITSHQQAIISSSLSNVHEYGWTQDAISQAVLKLKLPLSMSSLLQPKDLISHFMHDSNARLKTFLSQPELVKDQGSFDVYNKIERAIKYRLELVIPYVQSNTWHEVRIEVLRVLFISLLPKTQLLYSSHLQHRLWQLVHVKIQMRQQINLKTLFLLSLIRSLILHLLQILAQLNVCHLEVYMLQQSYTC